MGLAMINIERLIALQVLDVVRAAVVVGKVSPKQVSWAIEYGVQDFQGLKKYLRNNPCSLSTDWVDTFNGW
jgi:hypothetical protein